MSKITDNIIKLREMINNQTNVKKKDIYTHIKMAYIIGQEKTIAKG